VAGVLKERFIRALSNLRANYFETKCALNRLMVGLLAVGYGYFLALCRSPMATIGGYFVIVEHSNNTKQFPIFMFNSILSRVWKLWKCGISILYCVDKTYTGEILLVWFDP